MIKTIKHAAAIAAIIVSAISASCSDAVHAEDYHGHMGNNHSIPG